MWQSHSFGGQRRQRKEQCVEAGDEKGPGRGGGGGGEEWKKT